jgi:hypothetical protein
VSNSNIAHEKTKKRHAIIHHAKQPHGMAVIALVLFVAAWAVWTFVVW